MNGDPLKKLYNLLDEPTRQSMDYDTFVEQMKDPATRQKFYAYKKDAHGYQSFQDFERDAVYGMMDSTSRANIDRDEFYEKLQDREARGRAYNQLSHGYPSMEDFNKNLGFVEPKVTPVEPMQRESTTYQPQVELEMMGELAKKGRQKALDRIENTDLTQHPIDALYSDMDEQEKEYLQETGLLEYTMGAKEGDKSVSQYRAEYEAIVSRGNDLNKAHGALVDRMKADLGVQGVENVYKAIEAKEELERQYEITKDPEILEKIQFYNDVEAQAKELPYYDKLAQIEQAMQINEQQYKAFLEDPANSFPQKQEKITDNIQKTMDVIAASPDFTTHQILFQLAWGKAVGRMVGGIMVGVGGVMGEMPLQRIREAAGMTNMGTALADLGADLIEIQETYAPTPRKFTRNVYSNTAIIKQGGKSIQVDYKQNKPVAAFDSQGNPIDLSSIDKTLLKDAQPSGRFNWTPFIAQTNQTVADLGVQVIGAGKFSTGLKALGVGAKAAAYTGQTMAVAGQMAGGLYEEGLEAFDGDKHAAARYAVTLGSMIGMVSNVFGLETRLASGQAGFADDLLRSTSTAVKSMRGLKPHEAAAYRFKSLVGAGLGEGFEETMLEKIPEMGLKTLSNATGADFEVMPYTDTSDFISEGIIAFTAGALFGGGKGTKSLRADAIRLAKENPDKFLTVANRLGYDPSKVLEAAKGIDPGASDAEVLTAFAKASLPKRGPKEIPPIAPEQGYLFHFETEDEIPEELQGLPKRTVKGPLGEDRIRVSATGQQLIDAGYGKKKASQEDVEKVAEKIENGEDLNEREQKILNEEEEQIQERLAEKTIQDETPEGEVPTQETDEGIMYSPRNREELQIALQDAFELTTEEARAASLIYDARARAWAKARGRDPEAWYRERLEGIVKSTPEDLEEGEVKFQIGGEMRTTEKEKELLEQAEELEAQGVEPREIFNRTGWERGVDNKWRRDIEPAQLDLASVLVPNELESENEVADYILGKLPRATRREFKGKRNHGLYGVSSAIANRYDINEPLPLTEVLKNAEELLKRYPELEEYTFVVNPNLEAQGEVNTLNKTVSMNPTLSPTEMESVLVHEVQHIIQDIEGFPSGGSSNMAANIGPFGLNGLLNKLPMRKVWLSSGITAAETSLEEIRTGEEDTVEIVSSDTNIFAPASTNTFKVDTVPVEDLGGLEQAEKFLEEHIAMLKDDLEAIEKIEGTLEELLKEAEVEGGKVIPAFELYQRLAGEVEARNAQVRAGYKQIVESLEGANLENSPNLKEMLSEAVSELGAGIEATEDRPRDLQTKVSGMGEVMLSQNPDGSTSFNLVTRRDKFYSAATEAVLTYDQDKATPQQWIKMLQNVKGANQEAEAIGLKQKMDAWVEANNSKSIPKDVVYQFLIDEAVEIDEVERGANRGMGFEDMPHISEEDIIYELNLRFDTWEREVGSSFSRVRSTLDENPDVDEQELIDEEFDGPIDGPYMGSWGEELPHGVERYFDEAFYEKWTDDDFADPPPVSVDFTLSFNAPNRMMIHWGVDGNFYISKFGIASPQAYDSFGEAALAFVRMQGYGQYPVSTGMFDEYVPEGWEDSEEYTELTLSYPEPVVYTGGHFPENNTVVHIRYEEHLTPEWLPVIEPGGGTRTYRHALTGKEATREELGDKVYTTIRTIHVHEIQSDWAQGLSVSDFPSWEKVPDEDIEVVPVTDFIEETQVDFEEELRPQEQRDAIIGELNRVAESRLRNGFRGNVTAHVSVNRTDGESGDLVNKGNIKILAGEETTELALYVSGMSDPVIKPILSPLTDVDAVADEIIEIIESLDPVRVYSVDAPSTGRGGVRTKHAKFDQAVVTVFAAMSKSPTLAQNINTFKSAASKDSFIAVVNKDGGTYLHGAIATDNKEAAKKEAVKSYRKGIEDVKKELPAHMTTPQWAGLAFRKMFQRAAEIGADAITWSKGPEIAQAVGGPEDSLTEYYSKVLPSIAKKEARRFDKKANTGELTIVRPDGEHDKVNVLPLSKKVKDATEKSVPLFQQDGETKQGAFRETESGKVIIYALTDPNQSTPLHELAHEFEDELTDEDRQIVLEWAEHDSWDRDTSEMFARGFEKYLEEGRAPTPELQSVFEKFANWLRSIYEAIRYGNQDIVLNDAMRSMYAKLLGSEQVQAPEPNEGQNISKRHLRVLETPWVRAEVKRALNSYARYEIVPYDEVIGMTMSLLEDMRNTGDTDREIFEGLKDKYLDTDREHGVGTPENRMWRGIYTVMFDQLFMDNQYSDPDLAVEIGRMMYDRRGDIAHELGISRSNQHEASLYAKIRNKDEAEAREAFSKRTEAGQTYEEEIHSHKDFNTTPQEARAVLDETNMTEAVERARKRRQVSDEMRKKGQDRIDRGLDKLLGRQRLGSGIGDIVEGLVDIVTGYIYQTGGNLKAARNRALKELNKVREQLNFDPETALNELFTLEEHQSWRDVLHNTTVEVTRERIIEGINAPDFHIVSDGETWESIAADYGMDVDTLKKINEGVELVEQEVLSLEEIKKTKPDVYRSLGTQVLRELRKQNKGITKEQVIQQIRDGKVKSEIINAVIRDLSQTIPDPYVRAVTGAKLRKLIEQIGDPSSMKRFIREGIKDLDQAISDVVLEHFMGGDNTYTTLAEKLISELDLETDEALEVQAAFKRTWDNMFAKERDKLIKQRYQESITVLKNKLKRLQGEKKDAEGAERRAIQDEIGRIRREIHHRERKKKPPTDRLINDIALGVLGDQDLFERFADKWGFPMLSPEHSAALLALARQVKNANTGREYLAAMNKFMYKVDQIKNKKVRGKFLGVVPNRYITRMLQYAQSVYMTSILSGMTTITRAVTGSAEVIVGDMMGKLSAAFVQDKRLGRRLVKAMTRSENWSSAWEAATHQVKTGLEPARFDDAGSGAVALLDTLIREVWRGDIQDDSTPKQWAKRLAFAMFVIPATVTRLLGAVDVFLKTGMMEFHGVYEAYREYLPEGTADIMQKVEKAIAADVDQEINDEIDEEIAQHNIPPKDQKRYRKQRRFELKLDKYDPIVKARAYDSVMEGLLMKDLNRGNQVVRGIGRFTRWSQIHGDDAPISATFKLLARMLFPIVRVPTNLILRGLRPMAALVKGTQDPLEAKEMAVRGVSLVMMLASMGAMAFRLEDCEDEDCGALNKKLVPRENFRITGGGTGDFVADQNIGDGWRPMSIQWKMGDRWHSFSYIDMPWGHTLFHLGKIHDRISLSDDKTGVSLDQSGFYGKTFATFFYQQSYAQSLNDMAEFVELMQSEPDPRGGSDDPDEDQYVSALNRFAFRVGQEAGYRIGSYYPNIYRQAENIYMQAADVPKGRSPEEDTKLVGGFVGELEKRSVIFQWATKQIAPGYHEALLGETYDVLGYPIQPEFRLPYFPGYSENLMELMDNMINESATKSEGHAFILSRPDIFPPDRHYRPTTLGGVRLTDSEREELSRRTAEIFGQAVNQYARGGTEVNYNYFPKREKSTEINEDLSAIRRQASNTAKQEFLNARRISDFSQLKDLGNRDK
jgi:hypothetical protein